MYTINTFPSTVWALTVVIKYIYIYSYNYIYIYIYSIMLIKSHHKVIVITLAN